MDMRHLKYITILILLLLSGLMSSAQKSPSPREQKFLDDMKSGLNLSEQQYSVIEPIFMKAASQLEYIDHHIDSLERNMEDEELLFTRVAVFNQKKKDIAYFRDIDIRSSLDDNQAEYFRQNIAPLHKKSQAFGAHDRMKCNYCNR
jgi:hypothetical protein